MSIQPIGVFDSGIGGLSVWQEIIQLLPKESIVYYADQKNCPYGEKTQAEIYQFSANITDFLIKKGCKIIVVACNTATSAAIHQLRGHYSIPFVGMEPAIKPAAELTKSGKVGVIATKGTLNGRRFHEIKNRYAQDVEVLVQVGYGLVERIEAGQWHSPETEALLRTYLEPMLEKGIDQLVLGCTHYPFLRESIEHITQGKVNIINPAVAVAKQVLRVLQAHQLCNHQDQAATYDFYSSKDLVELKHLLGQIASDTSSFQMEIV